MITIEIHSAIAQASEKSLRRLLSNAKTLSATVGICNGAYASGQGPIIDGLIEIERLKSEICAWRREPESDWLPDVLNAGVVDISTEIKMLRNELGKAKLGKS